MQRYPPRRRLGAHGAPGRRGGRARPDTGGSALRDGALAAGEPHAAGKALGGDEGGAAARRQGGGRGLGDRSRSFERRASQADRNRQPTAASGRCEQAAGSCPGRSAFAVENGGSALNAGATVIHPAGNSTTVASPRPTEGLGSSTLDPEETAYGLPAGASSTRLPAKAWRYPAGLTPTVRRKRARKLAGASKPVAAAIASTLWPVVSRSSWARRTRASSSHWIGLVPVCSRKRRLKVRTPV